MNKAFSLIELSIVLTIIGIIAGASYSATRSTGDIYKIKQTNNKLDLLEQAIASYLATHLRLPCPADTTLTPSNSNYGVENCTPVSSPGSPNSISVSSPPTSFTCNSTNNKNIVNGMIPFATLNLPREFGVDGWNNKITYAVTQGLSKDPSYTGSIAYNDTIGACNMGLIAINGYSSNSITTSAAYVLLSYGPNQYYAYPENSSSQKMASSDTNEMVNKNTASRTYFQGLATSTFDDILRYKMAWQVIRDAGAVIENSSCQNAKAVLEMSDLMIGNNAFNPLCTSQPNSPDCDSTLNILATTLNQKMCLLK